MRLSAVAISYVLGLVPSRRRSRDLVPCMQHACMLHVCRVLVAYARNMHDTVRALHACLPTILRCA